MSARNVLFVWVLLLSGLLTACQSAAPAVPASKPAAPASAPGASPAAPAAAAPAPTELPGATTRVRIGVTGAIPDAPLLVAEERGYFREAGVSTELVQLDSATRMVPFLSTGDLQVGGGAPSLGLFRAIQQDIPLLIVANRARSIDGFPSHFYVVRPDLANQLQGFSDLKGRKIAIAGSGSTTHVSALRALTLGGLQPSDVDLLDMGFPDMPVALAGGAVDVVVVVEPFRTVAVRNGGVVWKTSQDTVPGDEPSVLLYAPSFARDNRALANRFMVAYLRGIRDVYNSLIKDDPRARAEMIQLLTRATSLKDPAIWQELRPTLVDPNGRVNSARIAEMVASFVADGALPNARGLDQIVDDSFIDYALQQFGEVPATTP
jgi:NitT/TauT family transport system substrate-binding protein